MGIKEKILRTLKDSKLVSKEDIDRALVLQKETGGSLGEVLVKLFLILMEEISQDVNSFKTREEALLWFEQA